MRKFLAAAVAAALIGAFGGAGMASATGNACPPASPNAGVIPPNCGNGNGGSQGNGGQGSSGNTCPPASPGAGTQPPCGNGGQGSGGNTCPPASPGAGNQPPCGNGGNGGNGGDGGSGGGGGGTGGGTGGATCPPGTGPISSIVQQISDAIRNGGGAPLADVVDQVNCQLIVGTLGL